jgi:hypothetical protein
VCTMICDMMRAGTNLARAALGATLLSMALLGSGCVKPVERDDARMSTTPEQLRRAPTQPAVRPQEDVVEATQKAPTTASKQPVQHPAMPPEEPVPAEPVYTASELMGKRQSEVTALMGTPARIEQRAASTVWVYEGADCGLDVFFFLDMATSDERVLTVAPSAESERAAAAAAAETPAAGGAAGGGATDAVTSQEGTVVDACYGKLRRS